MADEEQELDEQEQEQAELDRQIRTSKALQAMERELQLTTAVVMPVLLKLLKTFDGKWGHIEDENYRLLADAIFQQQEAAETEKAPGSSSGGRKTNGKKKGVLAMRAPTKRAPRNSKRAESDDSDENDYSQELIRRSKRAPADAFTHAAGMASLERAVVARRGRPSSAARQTAAHDDHDDPAWEPPLALLAPAPRTAPPQPCQEPQGGGGRRELRSAKPSATEVTTMEKGTQTEAADFVALTLHEPIQPTAIVCYEDPVQQPAALAQQPVAFGKQEDAAASPVLLRASEVGRHILSHVAPLKCRSGEVCRKCEKPKASVSQGERSKSTGSDPSQPPVSDPLKSLVFYPSRVKVEGQAGASSKREDTPLMCLNPEPLQTVVPTSPHPLALAVMEPPVQHFDVHSPEPLLLTFPSEHEAVGAETPKEVVPCSVKAPICELPKALMPYSVQSSVGKPQRVLVPIAELAKELELSSVKAQIAVAVEVDTTDSLSLEPTDIPLKVVDENPLMKVNVEVGLASKVEVEVKGTESSTQVEVQQPTENSISEGALAALVSYISESDKEGTDMSPELESGVSAPVEGIEEGVEQGKVEPEAEEVQGLLPVANTPSIAVLADASSRTEDLPEKSRDSWVVVDPSKLDKILPTLSGEVGEVARNALDSDMVTVNLPNPDDAAQPHSDMATEERKQSSGNTSSESSKKRKRHLIKKHEHEQKEQEVVTEKRRQRYDREDISRGKEKVAISLSAPNGEDLPKDFYYINSSVVYQSAHVGISMARIGEDDRCTSCVGNCLDNRTPCECTRLTTGEYAYTVEGQLYPHFVKQELERKADMKYLAFCQPGACPVERTSDENCKGHVQRRFIKECWEKCGCTQLCGNRIVQRGIARRLQVFWTEGGKGWGVRTLERLPAGTFVCEYVGEILTNTEMWCRNKEVHRAAKHHFALQLDADWCSEKILKDEEALCLDGTFYGNVARFINHRCLDSNLLEIPVEIESPDHHYYHLAFFTSKDVNKNEELTWDYQLDFSDKDHQLQAFECICGSPFCRGKVEDGKPWV